MKHRVRIIWENEEGEDKGSLRVVLSDENLRRLINRARDDDQSKGRLAW